MILIAALALTLAGLNQIPTNSTKVSPYAGEMQQLQPGEVPQGLTPADWDIIQDAIVAAEYHLAWHQADEDHPAPYYWAPNRAQGWDLVFSENGPWVTPRQGDDWQWGLSLTGFVYNLQPVPGTYSMDADCATLTYGWDHNLSEWWVNDPAGLEHGFTLRERP